MEIIYRTFDGEEFDNEADAAYHENEIKDGLIMLTIDGEPTDRTEATCFLYCKTEKARVCFAHLAEEQSDETVKFDTDKMTGFFFWDRDLEAYLPMSWSYATLFANAITTIEKELSSSSN